MVNGSNHIVIPMIKVPTNQVVHLPITVIINPVYIASIPNHTVVVYVLSRVDPDIAFQVFMKYIRTAI
ncbi:hypothetical protein ES703_23805 [subsurface metagenome]